MTNIKITENNKNYTLKKRKWCNSYDVFIVKNQTENKIGVFWYNNNKNLFYIIKKLRIHYWQDRKTLFKQFF